MKKYQIVSILTIALSLLLHNNASAQDVSTTAQKANADIKNEIKINLFSTILGLPEVNYERLLESNMGVGLALSFGIGNQDDFSNYKFMAIPYYRVYFGDIDGAGFFIEGNAGLGNVKEDFSDGVYYNNMAPITPITKFNFGLGAAVGKKFLTKNNFLGEIFGGVGRFFGDQRSVEVYPRVGISLGKRF